MSEFRAGKGFMGDAVYESVAFFKKAFAEIVEVFQTEFGPDGEFDGDGWIDQGNSKDLVNELIAKYGWEKEVDDFGYKAFKTLDWQGGQYRVTLVLTSRGSLKVDVRSWFVPK